MTIWRIRFASRIPLTTDTHSEYATFTAFPWWQWLRERASMLLLDVHCQSGSYKLVNERRTHYREADKSLARPGRK